MASKKKSIIIFNWRSPFSPMAGGAEVVTLRHAQYWVQRGHSVTWVSGMHDGAKQFEHRDGIDYYCIGSPQLLFLRAGWIYWTRFNGNFDILIDEVHGIPMFSPLWAFKSKKIVYIHEIAADIWDKMFPFPISTIGKFVERYIFPLVYQKTKILTVSKSTAKDLLNIGFSRQQISVVPNGIDIVPKSKKKKKHLQCIFVARLVPMKGVDYAIEVFSEIAKHEPKSNLLIVGKGPKEYVAKIKNMVPVNLKQRIKFLGYVTDEMKYALLAESHFLIHTSQREGFGLTVLEANSQGTPAAVFDVAALGEIVQHNKTGIVTAFHNTSQLGQKIVQIYRDKEKYKIFSQNAEDYSKEYSWEASLKKGLQYIEGTAT